MSLLKNIFSITNSSDKRHKVIVFGGLKFKFKRNQIKGFKFPKGTKSYFFISPDLNKYQNNKIAVFASFSQDGTIPEYVLHLLDDLKKAVDRIIFVADNPIYIQEAEKLRNYVDIIQCKRHEKYDFGSYKIGVDLAKKYNLLDYAEELIIMNDSCYGPVKGSLKDIINSCPKESDFYGLTFNTEINPHIQSYFYLFKKQVFNHKSFYKFLNTIKKEKSLMDVIYNYETKITMFLEKQGFKYSTFVPYFYEKDTLTNKCYYPITILKNYNCPLIKVKVLTDDYFNQEGVPQTLNYIKEQNENLYNIIINDIERRKK